ncbi:pre-mRNA 3'-end-processing factor FIP1, partial [Phenoliferia sp. Uapishka_3]
MQHEEDEDEQFLYGDEEDEPAKASVDVPAQPQAAGDVTPVAVEAEGDSEGGAEEDGDDESDDDFEIILDADPSAPPPPPPLVVAQPATTNFKTNAQTQSSRRVRRPVVAVRPPAPVPVKVPEPTVTLVDPSGVETSTDSPGPEAEGLAVPASVGLVPHGSLTPFGVGAGPLAAETNPNLDVDFVHKDANGNDLFDLDIDAIEDKNWRKPGANMADYFNYGMNEPAWKNYARKQKITRQAESAEKNPFAAFASGNLQESWQSLAPEFKAVMMATIMGYQPGMNPQQAQQGMMGMMSQMGMGGMGGMGG